MAKCRRSALLLLVTLVCVAPTRAQSPPGASTPPELLVQTGNSGVIVSLSVSGDGRLLASAGARATLVNVWDLRDGILLATIPVPGPTEAIAFEPGGRRLAVFGRWGLQVIDVDSGRVVTTVRAPVTTLRVQVRALTWKPAGVVVAYPRPGAIVLLDVDANRETTLPIAEEPTVLAFSPDGARLAAGAATGTVRIIEVATARELLEIRSHSPAEANFLSGLAFSVDGRLLASSGGTIARLWDASTGAALRSIRPVTPGVGPGPVHDVVFSPDGRWFGTVGILAVTLWDPATGRELRNLPSYRGWWSLALTPDGRTAIAGGIFGSIGIFDVNSGQEIASLGNRIEVTTTLSTSRDGRWMTTGTLESGRIGVWDLSAGTRTQVIEVAAMQPVDTPSAIVAFGSSGRWFASNSFLISKGGLLQFWEPATGRPLSKARAGSPTGPITSADGRWSATYDGKKRIRLRETPSGAEHLLDVGELGVSARTPLNDVVAFTPDGRYVLVLGLLLKAWRLPTGKEVAVADDAFLTELRLGWFADGRSFNAGGSVRAEAVPGRITVDRPGKPDRVRIEDKRVGPGRVAISPGGQRLAAPNVTDPHGGALIFDVATGRAVADVKNLRGFGLRGFVSLPQACCFVGLSVNGTIGIWGWDSGDLLATVSSIYAFDLVGAAKHGKRGPPADDWLVTTPDGLFDGTPAAFGRFIWRFGAGLFDVAPPEAFFNEFFRPGLLAEILAGQRPKAPRDLAAIDRRQPQITLSTPALAPGTAVAGREITVRLQVAEVPGSPGSGARDVRLFRNGSLVKVWRGDVLGGRERVTLETTLPIVAGDNRLTAYAFNRDNVKTSDAVLRVAGAHSLKRPGTAYVLAIGVNRHDSPGLDLRYAVADATAFTNQIRTVQDKLATFEKVEPVHLFDREATKANVLTALRRLAGGPGTLPDGAPAQLERLRRAQPEDAVFIFFAGHGVADEPRFYLVPHDIGGLGSAKRVAERGISDVELETELAGVDAGRLVLVVDACNSGQALETTEQRRGPMNSRGLAQLAYEKGMVVLTASQSFQAALEFERLGHGLLTFVLVEEGLKAAAADHAPADGVVHLREWLDFATHRVPELQAQLMKEASQRGRNVAIVAGEEKIADPGDRNLQRPRVFYRRERDSSPMVIMQR